MENQFPIKNCSRELPEPSVGEEKTKDQVLTDELVEKEPADGLTGSAPKNQRGPSQPLEPRGRGIPVLLFRRSRRGDASTRQRSPGAPPLPKLTRNRRSMDRNPKIAIPADRKPQSLWCQRPNPTRTSKKGEEAATPGQPARAHARFRKIPRRIHPREPPAAAGSATNHPAGAGKSHVFAEHTLGQIVSPRNNKNSTSCEETVDDHASLWKEEEN